MKHNNFNSTYKLLIFILIILDVFLVLYSCQKRESLDPITGIPVVNEEVDLPNDLSTPILVTGVSGEDVFSGVGTLGEYFVIINPRRLSGEMVPLRKTQALGDPFMVDITGYLNGSPCGDCFKMNSVSLNRKNEILVSFSLRHPFPLPSHNPPEYRERLDLHVFDVRAIFFLKDSNSSTVSFNAISNAVLNPIGIPETLDSDNSGFWASEEWDGSTDIFDDYVDTFWHTDSDIHPYKIFFKNGTRGNVDINSTTGFTDPYNPSGHNVFAQGSGPDTKIINLGNKPNQNLSFIVLITASYGQSARFWGSDSGQRGSPRYYLPEFNCKEPWRIKINIPSETDLLTAGDPMSTSIMNVEVCDWQHSYGTVRGEYNPRTAPFDSLQRSSKVKMVYAEIPGVSNLDQTSTPISGSGLGDDPLIYSLTVNNDLSANKGEYLGVVAVTDELHGSNIEGYGVHRDGITLFNVNSFVAYAVFKASVIDRGGGVFGIGTNMTSTGSGTDFNGQGVALDSIDGDNILVDGGMVHVVASVLDGPGGDGWDIYYFRSANHGLTFEPPYILNYDWELGYVGDQMEPSIAKAPDTGRIYFAFTDKSLLRKDVSNDAIFLRYSMDDGLTFSAPATRLSMTEVQCDQPSVAAGISGLVWVTYRQTNNVSDNGISLRYSFDYGHNFYGTQYIHTTPYNYDNPIVIANLSDFNNRMVGLVWRQESNYEGDLKFAYSTDSGANFSLPKKISFENYYEYATYPKVAVDSDGNIYCAYRVSNYWNESNKVFVTYGHHATVDYAFVNIGQINTLSTMMEDLDIFVSNRDKIYLAWSQVDNETPNMETDVFVYKGTRNGTSVVFQFLNRLPEPSEVSGSQGMPRLAGNEQNEIFLVYKDTSITYTGDIFITKAMDEM